MASRSSSITLHHPRLSAYEAMLEQIASGRDVWIDFLNRLPFSLGESAADRVAAYSFSDQVLETFNGSVKGLLDLIRRRADPAYDRQQRTQLLADKNERVVLWPERCCPRTLEDGGPLRKMVKLALLETAALDGGLLESWLTEPAGGRELFDTLVALQTKALTLSYRHPAYSGVALLNHLAILNNLMEAKEQVKQTRLRGFSFEVLDRACGMALHACLRQSVETALYNVGRPPVGSPEHHDLLVVLCSLGPLSFFSIQETELAEDINPYGLSPEVEQLLAPAYQAGLEHGNRPRVLLKTMLHYTRQPGPLRTSLLQHAGCEAFRRLVLDHLVAAEDPAEEDDRFLAQAYPSNRALMSLMENAAKLGSVAISLGKRLAERQHREMSWRESQRLLGQLESLRDHGPPWRQEREEDQTALQDLMERFLLHRMDEFANNHQLRARRRVIDRRPSTSTAELRRDYTEGRLYRLSADDQALVQARVVREEGQLFVDLKGYTRRTATAKEVVMAEFLKNEFYEPILKAAKDYYGGAQLVARDQNIQLVNLLGDAVAFSGNIVSLVNLARDIQEIFASYRKKLADLSAADEAPTIRDAARKIASRRAAIAEAQADHNAQLKKIKTEIFSRSSLATDSKVQRLQMDFEERVRQIKRVYQGLQEQQQNAGTAERAHLAARIDSIRQAYEQIRQDRQITLSRLKLLRGDKLDDALTDLICDRLLEQVREIENRLRALADEALSLDEAEEEDRQRRGSGLEAGLFISFGTAAEVIAMEDDVWGDQRVAVCERINEAARGTARNLVVKRRLDQQLATARKQLGQANLQFPFRVYVADTGTFRVEPELGRLWQKAQAEGDAKLLKDFIEDLVRSVQATFAEERGDKVALSTNDIYNLGEALSAGAIDAYLHQTRTTHFFFRIQIRPSELHEELQQRFYFEDEMISLVVGGATQASREETITFRYVGQVLFRGFERTQPTPVYEILRQDSAFMRLLRKHHLDDWNMEARQNPECKLESLDATCRLETTEPDQA